MNVEVSGEEAALIDDIGLQTLNGRQAVAYMRIRKVGNGDYERMERQRRVIALVVQKAVSYNKVKLMGLMKEFLPYIQTNLTTNEIIALGTQLLLSGEREIEQLQIPSTDLSYGSILSDGLYYLVPMTLEKTSLNGMIKFTRLMNTLQRADFLKLIEKLLIILEFTKISHSLR